MNFPTQQRNTSADNNNANKLTKALFLIYLGGLLWILMLKSGVQFSYMGNRSVNLVPFSKVDFSEVILNVVAFVPLGIYTGVLYRRFAFWKNVLLSFLISLVCEGLQFILRLGAFDVTDIIANTLGGLIGLAIFKAIEKLFNNSIKAQKFINIFAAIGTVIMISLLLLLKFNMLPIRYQ
jgi:glycopeptide antibiotics resistance protein